MVNISRKLSHAFLLAYYSSRLMAESEHIIKAKFFKREGDKLASGEIIIIKTAFNGTKSCAFATRAVCKFTHYISRKNNGNGRKTAIK